ncbi:MAG TPA: helix-turn-helix transcriptional regulator [Kiritimatiellia bacterium]|nr:helix-turn-helix transcriptional regulator [Kiritimatiellia bacterium]HRZ10820.1 helix-turn-helix transcriptional regulator [Kiritimatiellia bacterium]
MPENIVGTQVRRLRYQQELSQALLAAKLNRLGWDISRGTLAKIEAGIRCISDKEVFLLAKALKVPLNQLYSGGRA